MADSTFSKIVKSLWVLASFIPCLNGLGFAYIGAKEFNSNWIKEGLIYEAPWFLLFLFLYNDNAAVIFAGLGLLMELVSIIRSFMVYFKYKDVLIDDDEESRFEIGKTINSLWMIFSFIPYLSGLGIIFIGWKRNVRNWFLEGLFFEFLWVLAFIIIGFKGDPSFFMSLAMIGLILGIVRSFMIYFEEERMDENNFSTLRNILDVPTEAASGPVEEANSLDIIPQFRSYNAEIIDLKKTFNQKEANVNELINKRFKAEELSYDRFTSVIKNCHKLFYHQADSALSIISLAPEYSVRLDESVKGKIGIMNGIIEEMKNLIEEFILLEGSDEKTEEDLKELFVNMDNLINSVKDYK